MRQTFIAGSLDRSLNEHASLLGSAPIETPDRGCYDLAGIVVITPTSTNSQPDRT
jgi:hypothetical protein